VQVGQRIWGRAQKSDATQVVDLSNMSVAVSFVT
jgi:hypothetical protein